MDLTEHHVPGTTDTYYIPDFVTEDEEAYLLRKVSPTVVVAPLDTLKPHRSRRHPSRSGSNFRTGGTCSRVL